MGLLLFSRKLCAMPGEPKVIFCSSRWCGAPALRQTGPGEESDFLVRLCCLWLYPTTRCFSSLHPLPASPASCLAGGRWRHSPRTKRRTRELEVPTRSVISVREHSYVPLSSMVSWSMVREASDCSTLSEMFTRPL